MVRDRDFAIATSKTATATTPGDSAAGGDDEQNAHSVDQNAESRNADFATTTPPPAAGGGGGGGGASDAWSGTNGSRSTKERRRTSSVVTRATLPLPLPLEVVERILGSLIEPQDDLDCTHYGALRSSALVCRAWSGVARRALLQRVMLDARSLPSFLSAVSSSSSSSSSSARRRGGVVASSKEVGDEAKEEEEEDSSIQVETLFVRDVYDSRLDALLRRIRDLKKLIISIESIDDEGIDIPAHLSSLESLVILRTSPFQVRPPPTIPVTPIWLRSFRYVVGQISPLWIYRVLESSRDTIKSLDVEFPDDLADGDCVEGWLPFLPLFEHVTVRNPREWLAPHFESAASVRKLSFDLDYDDASDIQPILSAIPHSGQIESLAIVASRSDEDDLLIESSRWILNEKALAGLKRVRYPAADEGSSFTRSPSYKRDMANEFMDLLAERGIEVVFEPNREYYS